MNNDIERAQEMAERVNQALEGTGHSVTVEDMIVLSDRMMASGWDISTFLLEDVLALIRDILWNHTSTPKPSSVKPAGKVQPSEITIYPNVGVNQLRLGMTHDEVEQILGKPQWVSEPFDDIPAQEDYCWNGYPNWIFRLAFREGQLTEIMICLDETREQNIPVMLCGAELSAGHPEEIVPKLLAFSDCYYSTYPQSQEMYQKYHVTPREQSLEYLFDGLGVYFTRFTDFHPNYLGTDYYDGWNPEAAEDEQQHWNMETVTLHTQQAMDYLRDGFNSRDPQSN